MMVVFNSVKPGDFGIIGDPVAHSLSPKFQQPAINQWWEESGRPRSSIPTYHRFQIPAAEMVSAMAELRALELQGFNVTLPHKETMLELVNSLDESAARMGAVNTVLHQKGRWVGYNTDGFGFLAALKEMECDPRTGRVLVLGLGGTGSVIIRTLLSIGVNELLYWNRSPDKVLATEDGRLRRLNTLDELVRESPNVDLIVNCTAVGLNQGDGLPAPGLTFRAGQSVFDVIYNRETEFLRPARAAGACASGGLAMLLYQGAKSFEILTGAKAPLELMRKSLELP
jgi:shikimate dehydrogenase